MFNKEKLQDLIAERKLSQGAFAAEIGVSQPFVAYMLQGYKEPSLAVTARIAKYFDLRVDDFINK